jgi:hypothetical protein
VPETTDIPAGSIVVIRHDNFQAVKGSDTVTAQNGISSSDIGC